MQCHSCGREIVDQAHFCGYCGAAHQPTIPTAQPAPPAPPATPAPPPSDATQLLSPDETLAPLSDEDLQRPTQRNMAPAPPSMTEETPGLPATRVMAPVPGARPAPPGLPPTLHAVPISPAAPPNQPPSQRPAAPPRAQPAPRVQTAPRRGAPVALLLVLIAGGLALAALLGVVWLVRNAGSFGLLEDATPTPRPAPVAATLPPTSTPAASPTPPRVPVSLANGTNVTPPVGPDGLGKLTIKNGTNRDGVAKLVEDTPDKKTRRFVYVQANHDVTIDDVGEGTYRLLFMTGIDWDAGGRKFLREVQISQFDEPFAFKEEQTPEGTRYSTWEVSLNPVAGGTGHTSPVPEGAFGTD
jgi:hypothetical protein